ncbi:hypothetical protein ACFD2S_000597 [Listeria monocytogenes]|nr:hypothetical protein [Listeria monocytogenes]EKL6214528.1 hypothetical protein [Listeria monocytogenes]MBV1611109.1 hypothetical protein [Listeria monocytogenes]NVR76542.1 hypothetical protein [Listeria monocytogenes]NVR79707.1 hypothetical protein [Listeria monocytogenes]
MENLNLLAFQALNQEMTNEYYQSLDESLKFKMFLVAEYMNDTLQYADDSTSMEYLFELWDWYWDMIQTHPNIGDQLELEKEYFNDLLIDDPENVLISGYFKVMFFSLIIESNKLNTHYSADESNE